MSPMPVTRRPPLWPFLRDDGLQFFAVDILEFFRREPRFKGFQESPGEFQFSGSDVRPELKRMFLYKPGFPYAQVSA